MLEKRILTKIIFPIGVTSPRGRPREGFELKGKTLAGWQFYSRPRKGGINDN
jgi:hypothetical protein